VKFCARQYIRKTSRSLRYFDLNKIGMTKWRLPCLLQNVRDCAGLLNKTGNTRRVNWVYSACAVKHFVGWTVTPQNQKFVFNI
jgi:hypothetical protein